MKISTISILLLLAMGACVIIAIAMGAPEGAGGVDHPTIKEMSIGGDGEARHKAVFGVAWVFGVCMILLFTTCLALGASRGGKLGDIKIFLIVGAVLHVAAFSALVLAYRPYMTEGSAIFMGSLPLPSAIMMYLLWWTPSSFVAIYFFGFKRFIFSDEDAAKFAALVEARRTKENGGTD